MNFAISAPFFLFISVRNSKQAPRVRANGGRELKDFASHARSARCLLKMGRKPNSKVSRRSPSIPFQCPLRWRRRPHSRGVCGVPAITAASPGHVFALQLVRPKPRYPLATAHIGILSAAPASSESGPLACGITIYHAILILTSAFLLLLYAKLINY